MSRYIRVTWGEVIFEIIFNSGYLYKEGLLGIRGFGLSTFKYCLI